MIAALVLTHGNLARELLDAARMIDSQIEDGSAALALPWDEDSDVSSAKLKKQLRELDNGDGVIILTDMFGGTASNLAMPFLAPGKVEVVTGVNLPMLIKLASLRSHDLSLYDLAVRLSEAAQKSMRVASDFLRKTT